MSWNIRLALWITHLLCPRIGAAQPTRCPDKIEVNEDILWNRNLEPDELGVCGDDLADWAEYVAHQQSTRHHLDRCLNK